MGGFSDKDGFNGNPPSAAVLGAALWAVFEDKELWCHRRNALLDGEKGAIEGSHTVAKAIRGNDKKVRHARYTVLSKVVEK